MERFEEALEALDARVKIPERGYSTQYDKLYEMCRNIDLIEQELGIPLEVLFKALKEGVYAKFEENKILKADIKLYYNLCQSGFKIKAICLEIGQYEDFEWEDYFFVKNYGKSWALTKEELMNENNTGI